MAYKVYYNPRYDLLGLFISGNYIRIYLQPGARTFMAKTSEWVEVGDL